MLESNMVALLSPYYRRLTDSQLCQINNASLEILENTGIRFQEDEAIVLFKKAGIDVTDGNRVHVPAWRVEWALGLAPKQIILYDQTGSPAIRLNGRKSYYGNGSDLVKIIDHRTDEHRKPVIQDVRDFIRLLDALPHYDFAMSGFIPSDITTEKVETTQMLAMLENTLKPIIYVTTNMPDTERDVAMAEVVAGGEAELRRRPFAACYINITNPLRHNPDSIQKLLFLSRKRLPFVYRPAIVTRGVSTPVTVPGFLAVNNAAFLAGLVLSQLCNEGAPFIRDSCAGGTFDMKTAVGLHSAPEVRGFNEELARFYDIPSFGIGGTSAAKVVDQQAAMEAALTLITSTLAGAQLIHDVGYMDSGKTGSLTQIVICHEIISWAKQYMKGLVIDDESLALHVIQEVGTDGEFLTTEHTLKHFKEDEYPELRDHRTYEDWLKLGGTTLKERARDKVEKILADHQPEKLEKSKRDTLLKIINAI
jgi:trimethylamine--corrinoid protein Co-methyltransferase